MTPGRQAHKAWGIAGSTLALMLSTTGRANTDFSGIWKIASPMTRLTTVGHGAPPLNAPAAALYRMRAALAAHNDHSFDPAQRCEPPGEPRILTEPFSFEITQSSDQIVFTYEWNALYRIVDIGPATPPQLPTYFGTSAARWSGAALDIDVIGLREDTLLDASGLPHSASLSLHEHLELSSHGRRLVMTIQLNDPATFTQPWNAQLVFLKQPGDRLPEDTCEERLGYVK